VFYRRIKNKSLFYRWLLSYFSILLIPLIISGVISVLSVRILARETTIAVDNMLRQTQREVDGKIRNMQEVARQVSLNADAINVMSAGATLSPAHDFSNYRLRQAISNLLDAQTTIDNIYIYHRASNRVLSRATRMSTSIFYDRYFSAGYMTYEELMEKMQREYFFYFHILNRQERNDNTTGVIAFFRFLPSHRLTESQGTLIVTIPVEVFQDTLNDLRWNDNYQLMVFDDRGQLLISNGPQHFPSYNSFQHYFAGENERFTHLYNGNRYEISILISAETGWRYVVVMPSEVFNEITTGIRTIALYGFLICGILGAIIAYFFAKRHYDPLDEMVQALVQKRTLTSTKMEHDYGFMINAINQNIEEMQLTFDKLERQDKEQRNQMIRNVLRGGINSGPIEASALFGDKPGGPLHSVLLISIDRTGVFFADEKNEKLAAFALTNVLEELFSRENCVCCWVEMDGFWAWVINFQDSGIVENKRKLDYVIDIARMYVTEQLKIDFTVAVSNIHGDVSNIPTAYQEALSVMEYRRLFGVSSGSSIKYESIENQKYSYDYSSQTEGMLSNYIKAGEFENASGLIDKVIHANLISASFSGLMARLLMYDIISTVVKVVYEICDIDFIENTKSLKRLLSCNDIADIRTELRNALEVVCQYVKSNTKDQYQLSKAVMSHINANYADSSLSVSSISVTFGLTRSYLSTLFKTQTNQTLLYYIGWVRIDKAKKLLREGDASVKDIGTQTGFLDSNVFIKTFKKYEGVTPGEYRKIADISKKNE